MKLWSIESNRFRLDGGSMFGNAPKNLWKKWFLPDEENRIELASRTLLMQTAEGRNILFEAGIGAFFDPKLKERYGITDKEHRLIKNLAAAGFRDEDIDIIILSHLHFDHAGGLLAQFEEGPMRLLFPKAKFFVGKEHWIRACRPHLREKASFIPELNLLLEKSGRLNFIEGPTHSLLDFGVKFFMSNGHTIGLFVSLIETPSGPIAFASDLIPGMPWVHIPIAMGYDRFPERTIEEKKSLYDYLIPRNGKLFFTHDPSVDLVSVTLGSDGKYSAQPVVL